MVNTSMIISREMRPKVLCSNIDEEVVVPGVIGGDEEEVFARKSSLMGEYFSSKRKSVMSLARTRDFFLLGVDKSRSYSWRIMIH
jgi:hypothetical protein